MIEILNESSGRMVGFSLSGKLHDKDYKIFVPQMERVIEREGKVRLLALFHDFHGWDLHAAWDDMAFGAKHFGDIEKIALVGDRKWEEWMAKIGKPFTRATVKYFDSGEMERAWVWLREEQSEAKGRTE